MTTKKTSASIFAPDGSLNAQFISDEVKKRLEEKPKDGQAQPHRFTNREVGGAIFLLGVVCIIGGRAIANEPEPEPDDHDSNKRSPHTS